MRAVIRRKQVWRFLALTYGGVRVKKNVVRATVALIPSHIQALLGAPPLLMSEDSKVYNDLLGRFADCIQPNDIIEWLWVKDITDHTWEIRRLRRLKIIFVDMARVWDEWTTFWFAHPEDRNVGEITPPISAEEHAAQSKQGEKFLRFLRQTYFDGKQCSIRDLATATELSKVMPRYDALDRPIASAERRRDRTLREISFRRAYLAQRLRKASDEIIGQFEEVVPLAAE
jgi:hypothetical protein